MIGFLKENQAPPLGTLVAKSASKIACSPIHSLAAQKRPHPHPSPKIRIPGVGPEIPVVNKFIQPKRGFNPISNVFFISQKTAARRT
jgi:hypothetical protein